MNKEKGSDAAGSCGEAASGGIPGYYVGVVAGPALPFERREALLGQTRRYIDGRRRLDPEGLIAALAPDAVYESQDVTEPLAGAALIEYLRKRYAFLRTLQASRDLGRWVLGEIDLPAGAAYPCAVVEADGRRQGCHVLTLDAGDRIVRIDILTVAPPPSEARLLE